jgi:hypothetical protein
LSKAAIISSTASCGPSIAAMPANCDGALTQDQQLTASLRTLSISPSGQIDQPSRQPVIAQVFDQPFNTISRSRISG